MTAKERTRGFTLIELMITLVIVAILAGIAVPSYRNYVLRSHRVEATSALLRVAAAQEKFYLQNNTYTKNLGKVSGLGFSDSDSVATFLTENGWYEIEAKDPVSGDLLDGFILTATAKGDQVNDADCTSFTLESSGKKTASTDKCWRK
jgi:type IV pilus assembly protein PilE